MNRPWHTWTVFGGCLFVVLAALGWISGTVLELDRAEAEANKQAEIEESIRLALWRMDSALGPLIAQESRYPYFAYQSFYPAERAYTLMFNQIQPGEVLLPSTLLTFESPSILLHLQLGPDDRLTSPQVPTGNMRDLAESAYTTRRKIEASAQRLTQLEKLLKQKSRMLISALPRADLTTVALARRMETTESSALQSSAPEKKQPWAKRSDIEQQARIFQQQVSNQLNYVDLKPTPGSSDVFEGPTKPIWIGPTLLLARRVSVEGQTYVQGCWLDWKQIKEWLKEQIRDLLPHAELEPMVAAPLSRERRTLAALPVRLIPGHVPVYVKPRTSPVRTPLLIAWVCVLFAAAAAAVLLSGTISLSERRAAFVSAVTHEMRTPLTTFRMYTDMLIKGMLPDEAKRRRYLTTLGREAQRLSHLVENVLAYARLDRHRSAGHAEKVILRELIDRAKERPAERAQQAGMNLIVKSNDAILERQVCADASAVEQILFNLVDNACKYAASGAESGILLEIDRAGDWAHLRVKDHGPGIGKGESRRLFRPFSKSAREAANSAPGVGLGLALSRRLARDMGGDLQLLSGDQRGACFLLTLRMA
ncbi:MAG: HAMP domain-containing histidine kinase [Phycisphaerales bacterium]|nr:HAMP domain-containing histidine kinase [Phycisphaerales bacterium]